MSARTRLHTAARITGQVESALDKIVRPTKALGFPFRAPTVPRGVEVPTEPSQLGRDYNTDWARSPVAKVARAALVAGPVKLLVEGLARPEVFGHDRLADLLAAVGSNEGPPSVIFAANHHSHLDTALMVQAVPAPWRPRLVTGAAADYFFDTEWKARLSALSLNAIPVDRETTNRQTFEQISELLSDGWSLVIYPEGGRSPDGWGQDFKGGAAYLASRLGIPVIPVHIDGTDSIFPKGSKRPKPGRTRVTFGRPLHPAGGESTRRFNERIERAVAELADESSSDYWSARRRAATGETPALTGPESRSWRRSWQRTEHQRRGVAGWKHQPERSWPDLG